MGGFTLELGIVLICFCGVAREPATRPRIAPAAATFTFKEITAFAPPLEARIGLPSIG